MLILVLNKISLYSIPIMILSITVYGAIRGVKLYETFVEGAKGGFTTAIKIISYLVAMLVAIGIFRESGAMEMLGNFMSPVTDFIGMPKEVLPMAIMRPLSGGGSAGIMNDIFANYGPDSLAGRIASIMYGSTETTLYTVAVYFGAVAIRKTRHAIIAGLLADAAGILASVYIARLMFT
jgi:spore maturation protein B